MHCSLRRRIHRRHREGHEPQDRRGVDDRRAFLLLRWSISAPVIRIGPMTFVVSIETSSFSSTAAETSSMCMMPALLMSTLSFG